MKKDTRERSHDSYTASASERDQLVSVGWRGMPRAILASQTSPLVVPHAPLERFALIFLSRIWRFGRP